MDELNLKDDDPRKISRNDLLWYNQNKKAITTAAATYTIIQNIDILICTATCTVTLPKATRGRELHIKKRFAGTAITVNPNGSETIDGAASLSMTATNEAQWLKAISGNWIVL